MGEGRPVLLGVSVHHTANNVFNLSNTKAEILREYNRFDGADLGRGTRTPITSRCVPPCTCNDGFLMHFRRDKAKLKLYYSMVGRTGYYRMCDAHIAYNAFAVNGVEIERTDKS